MSVFSRSSNSNNNMSGRNQAVDIWEVKKPIWHRMLSPKRLWLCWRDPEAHVERSSASFRASPPIAFPVHGSSTSSSQEAKVPSTATTGEDFFMIEKAAAARRPPLAVRAATHTATSTTPRSASLRSAPPQPVKQRLSLNPMVVPMKLSARGVSYSSVNSRHRRDAALLPSIQRIHGTTPEKSTCVPGTIDPAKCLRQISALADDFEDDRTYDISLSSSEEEGISKDEECLSPTSVMPIEEVIPTGLAAADWMLSWADNGSIAPSSVFPSSSFEALSVEDQSSAQSASTLNYLQVEPQPLAAARQSAFIGCWAAVFFQEDTIIPRYDDDESEDGDTVPAVTAKSLYYFQLLEGGALQLTPAVSSQPVIAVQMTRDSRWSVIQVSKRAGNCLHLPSEKIDILPVHLSARYLEKVILLQEENTKNHNDFFVPAEEHYAPQEQHDAIVHLRFAMDAALRL